jgi:hypothetical protein
MDFKSIISKIESIDGPIVTPAAPQLPKSVQLNEDAQLRVLAGTSSVLAEAKKKADEDVKEAAEKTPTTWTDKSGKKHPATKVKGDKYQGKEAEDEEKKSKKKDESVDPQFKSKFMKMVEAKKSSKKKPDDDNDGVPNWADEKPGEDDNAGKAKGGKPKKGVNPFAKKESVGEAAEKTPTTWTDKSGKKHPATKVKGDKYTGKEAEKEAKNKEKADESKMMPKGKKRPVAESVEQKLSFREMMNLVVESGGQQQIDAVDSELFAWAQRVAKQKVGEGMKADVYAGLVYERMGGVFQMYDVLSEDQK